ncbi:helix-turn-helix domain-containing protein [Rhizobium nepotum]|uniref:helix-turn-helix domain-containing protein n=1 Tax=Rhizobium nepotum TaxID=1035271 RepID=UPI003CFA6864
MPKQGRRAKSYTGSDSGWRRSMHFGAKRPVERQPVSHVAKRAGAAQSALHRHFGAKEQLLRRSFDAALSLFVRCQTRHAVGRRGETGFVDEMMGAARRRT